MIDVEGVAEEFGTTAEEKDVKVAAVDEEATTEVDAVMAVAVSIEKGAVGVTPIELVDVPGRMGMVGVADAQVPFKGELGMTIGGVVDHGPYKSKFITAIRLG